MALGDYDLLLAAERSRVGQQYGQAQQGLEKSIHGRGIGRSGFAGEQLTKLGSGYLGALGEVNTGMSDRLMDYKYQRQMQEYYDKMAHAQSKRKKRGMIGQAIGSAGQIIGAAMLSDKNAKTNVKGIGPKLAQFKKLDAVEFNWKANGKPSGGVIAQDVAKKMPELAVYDSSTGKPVGADYGAMTALLLEGFKRQQGQIDKLRKAKGA